MYIIEKNGILEYLDAISADTKLGGKPASKSRTALNKNGEQSATGTDNFFGGADDSPGRRKWKNMAFRNIIVRLIPLCCLLNHGANILEKVLQKLQK